MSQYLPQRIACLSTESVEVLYALGEEARVVGISGFTTRPARARKEKPKISGFSTARIDKILAVKPDLVLAFSDLQGDICRDLVKAGIAVHHFNQRSVAEILAMIATVGRLVGAVDRAAQLVVKLEAQIAAVRATAATLPRRPRVYFEEWDEPMISGIQWVSELITIAGGDDIFADLAQKRSARERIIAEKSALARRQPDIVFASWCGKKFQPARFAARFAGEEFPALATGEIHEIKSAHILSPGPAAIEAGLPQLARLIQRWATSAA
ncbi:ABC transporter substrate-binding protein [Rugosibacter aromaticivorans]|uniref:ABC transporter substrate-binding protein n=1 Tax=Rugosibacter aromaticivorans TaxID=1565605 RepID=A0A0C5J053_9PROT|nr:ABC transporter substrate-binding protein [Rugosibacter aromaticivorans]AJP48437.1 ABC transporter substrate-binding protein [Rugosibacter aromaticivorans]